MMMSDLWNRLIITLGTLFVTPLRAMLPREKRAEIAKKRRDEAQARRHRARAQQALDKQVAAASSDLQDAAAAATHGNAAIAIDKAKEAAEKIKVSRVARMAGRYGMHNGSLLSSGMALTALLSLVAFLTAGLTLAVAFIGSNPDLNATLAAVISDAVPGLLKTSSHPEGFLSLDALVRTEGTVLTGVFAFCIAAWGATSCIASMGRSIRLMFGLTAPAQGLGGPLVRAAIGLILVPLLGLGASLLGIATQIATDWVFPSLGITGVFAHAGTAVAGFVLSLLMYAALAWVLISVVAAVRPPKNDLLGVVAIIAVGSWLLRTVGMTIIQMNSNPVMAAATAIVTVILWLGFQVQIILWACAWAANPPAIPSGANAASRHAQERPNYVTMSVHDTLKWQHNPVTGAPLE